MARKKPWAVINKRTGQHIEFFENPTQSNNYIENRYGNSKAFGIRRLP